MEENLKSKTTPTTTNTILQMRNNTQIKKQKKTEEQIDGYLYTQGISFGAVEFIVLLFFYFSRDIYTYIAQFYILIDVKRKPINWKDQ